MNHLFAWRAGWEPAPTAFWWIIILRGLNL